MKTNTMYLRTVCTIVALIATVPAVSLAQSKEIANMLAKKVANPLTPMISVPFQYNYDGGYGPLDKSRSVLNLQPVVPISFSPTAPFRLLSRTILPFAYAPEGDLTGDDLTGIGDITQSLFVTTARPLKGGWLIGAGPVAQLPTGSDDLLTTDKWSLGPTALAVCQNHQWTYGAMVNHLWSIGGNDERADISTSFMQPFVNYILPTHTTLALNLEASRDWEAETWSVPVNFMVNQLLKVGKQPISAFVGVRYWADTPEYGPDGWGMRAGVTLLFPKKPKGGMPNQGGMSH